MRAHWERLGAGLTAIVGLVCLLLGWFGVSGRTLTPEQLPYVASGGLLGIFALGIAGTLWLSAYLKDEWRKLDDIYQVMIGEAENGSAKSADVAAEDGNEGSSRSRRRGVRTTASA